MTDSVFGSLISLQKTFVYPKSVRIPHDKELKVFRLKAEGTKDGFILDCDRRGTYELKHKNQLRHNKDFVMVRLEINAPPHKNPDGRMTSRNHIHIYKEGYGLRWAYEFDEFFGISPDDVDPLNFFILFCEYCNIDLSNINLQGVF